MLNFDDIRTYPISERDNKFRLDDMIPTDHHVVPADPSIVALADCIRAAKGKGGKVLFFLDPVDRIGIWINKLCRRRVVKTGTWSFTNRTSPPDKDGFVNETWQLNVTLVF